jgi:ABC-type lipopolysaccharide export system ATPase subunit
MSNDPTTAPPLLVLERLQKVYTRGLIAKRPTFRLEADLAFEGSAIVGVVGPNGAGKTTLFEMITGSNVPSSGRVLVGGQDIHRVKYAERDRLAIHYHQSYQVRSFTRRVPSAFLDPSPHAAPRAPPFRRAAVQYAGWLYRIHARLLPALRREGRLVFVCLHPTARYHLEILKEISERFLLVHGGRAEAKATFSDLVADDRVRTYLGREMSAQAEALA